MRYQEVGDTIIFNQWRFKTIFRIFGTPVFLASCFALFKILTGDVSAKAGLVFSVGLSFLVGLFLLSLDAELCVSAAGIYERKRFGFWIRRRHIPAKSIKSIRLTCESETQTGGVGADSGANTTSNYYGIEIGDLFSGRVFIGAYASFTRSSELDECWSLAQKLSRILSKPLELDKHFQLDLERAGTPT